ncbi:YcfL family protein [Campylobacter canadensis]|uniref:YcfL family protein n=1 Tax=Campylobacter canadensis TaxID=449520 RepID=A0ABS7WSG1_9BACT|nr:YcfL family protein [Campylobacter canadensis]MBZ7986915.1 YcfL family protein [Campylobacter canadensis]MBZ7994237.1 YcfL family protein [Campylobacter canadensis]MBZ7995771.1 YcfL family protein [Campylobacter canadensis]MBZ7997952.1 YcfL family protein [Campylobacter canadensis]MBZ7999569.1 YcfL family protein [Campylobacter canadensis]
MKKILLFTLTLFLISCTNNSNNVNTNTNNNLKQNNTLIKNMKTRINDNNLLEVELTLQSSSTKDIMYKITWLDNDGFVLKDALSDNYQSLRLNAKDEIVIKKIAADIRAKDVKIDIKSNSKTTTRKDKYND